jgi:hypothetical protein
MLLPGVCRSSIEGTIRRLMTASSRVLSCRLVAVQANRYRKNQTMIDVILKRFEEPDEITTFEKGKFETVSLGGMTIGRATYGPGWKWSRDVGQKIGEAFCTVEHVGMVVSGCATAAFADGRVTEMHAGDVFYVPPEPHDSWVVGEEAYVSLHFMGAAKYAR